MSVTAASSNPAFLRQSEGPVGAKSLLTRGSSTNKLAASDTSNPKKRQLNQSDGFQKRQKLVQRSGLSDPTRIVETALAEKGDNEEKSLEREVQNLKAQLNASKEKTDYWRRKSLDLETVLTNKKAKAKLSISALEEKVEEMTAARIQLQNKLAEDSATNEKAMDELSGLLEAQSELENDKMRLLEEMEVLQSSCQEAKEKRSNQIEELRAVLQETLGDLKGRLAELKTAKEALHRAKARVEALQKTAIADNTENASQRAQVDRREQRITQLSELVEKLVFKASVLSQTNSELKAKIGGEVAEQAAAKEALPGQEKMELLEQMCLKRYSKIMKQAGQRVHDHKQVQLTKTKSF